MRKLITRYGFAIALIIINILVAIIYPSVGAKAFNITMNNVKEMIMVIPPIFILLGLLDVWIKREVMIKLMGEGSGIRGALIAFLMGSAAAGPLYAAFPIAAILLKKGSKLSNVLIFMGAWSTTKIPLLLFEAASMGWAFMIIRFTINIFGIAAIAFVTERALSDEDKKQMYDNAASMD